jgi:hypothetical protein
MQVKNIVIAVLVLILIGVVGYLSFYQSNQTVVENPDTPDLTATSSAIDNPVATTTEKDEEEKRVENRESQTVLGESVNGQEIIAYHFGEGQTELLLIGGVHGSYSPNTSALGNELVSYFTENTTVIPDNLMVTVIPNLNPDGSKLSGTAGRFNANTVDLNRNFDCEWSEKGMWQSREVSGGSAPFSEPEAEALRDYFVRYDPSAVIVWFSAEGKVYPSACAGTPSRQSVELAATFATSAGYPAEAEFNAYAITGDMVNWMAKLGTPAISVLLSDHQNSEFDKNLAGVTAVLNKYAE